MSVIYNRIDGRMVHGQVATTWAKTLQADEILVLNDEAAYDDTQVALMKLAAPGGCEVDVFTVKTGVEIIQEEDFNGERTFIIFKTIQDAMQAAELGYFPDTLYIGGMYQEEGKKEVAIALCVDEKDKQCFRFLENQGVKLIYQVSPLNKEKKLQELIAY